MKPYLKVKRIIDQAILPSKRSEDAGFDLYGIFEEDFTVLKQGDIKMCRTGIAIQIPQDWVFYIAERGSTGSKGLSRRCGVVDSGFRGEIFVPLNNTSNKIIILSKHNDDKLENFLKENNLSKEEIIIYPTTKAIAQGMILYCPHIEIEVVDELENNSERGGGALGSSNK